MTTSLEMVLIGGIINSLVRHDSWCSETHIQKTSYLAKSIFDVPFEAEFVLYKHGPYSFDLNKSLNHMQSRGLLSLIRREWYGPSYRVNGAMWSVLNRATRARFLNYAPAIDRICEKVGKRNVAELERIATAVYIDETFDTLSERQRVGKLTEIKPHVSSEMAVVAFREAHELVQLAEAS